MKKVLTLTIFAFAILSIFSFALIGNENESINNDVSDISLEQTSTQVEETESTKKVVRSSGRSSSSSSETASDNSEPRTRVFVGIDNTPADEYHEQNPDAREQTTLDYCKSGRYLSDNRGMYDTCKELLEENEPTEPTRTEIKHTSTASTSCETFNEPGVIDSSVYEECLEKQEKVAQYARDNNII